MPLIDPFHLLGTYRTPAFRRGEEVHCLARDHVIMGGEGEERGPDSGAGRPG